MSSTVRIILRTAIPALTTSVLLCLSPACSDERTNLTWPSSIEVAFTVVVPEGWRGTPGELEIEGPMLVAASPPLVLETPSSSRVFVLGLAAADGVGVHPRATALEAWSLRPKSVALAHDTSCGRDGWVHEDRELELPLGTEPLRGRSFELSSEGPEWTEVERPPFADHVSLWLGLRPCLGGRRLVLTPFAEGTGGERRLQKYGGLWFLDADHLALWTFDRIEVMSRGSPRGSGPQLAIDQFPLPALSPDRDEAWRIDTVGWARSSSMAAGLVAVSRGPRLEGAAEEGRLFELRVRPDGLELGPELWRSQTGGLRSSRRLEKIVFGDDDVWVAVGDALVLTGTGWSLPPRELSQPDNFDGLYLEWSGHRERPFLVGGRSFLRWFAPERGADGFEAVTLRDVGGAQSVDAVAVKTVSERSEIFILTNEPTIGRRDAGTAEWTHVPVHMSEAPVTCTPERHCGRARASRRGRVILPGPAGLEKTSFVAPEHCGALYLVSEIEECAISADLEPDPELLEGSPDESVLYDAESRGERTMFVGDRRRVLEAHIE